MAYDNLHILKKQFTYTQETGKLECETGKLEFEKWAKIPRCGQFDPLTTNIFRIYNLRDYQQITFAKLNRLSGLSKPHPLHPTPSPFTSSS